VETISTNHRHFDFDLPRALLRSLQIIGTTFDRKSL
jgi:hypothetical protein